MLQVQNAQVTPWDDLAAASLVAAVPTPTLVIDGQARVFAVSDSWRGLLEQAGVPDPGMWLPGADLLPVLEAAARGFPGVVEIRQRLQDALDGVLEPLEIAVPFPTGPRWFIVAMCEIPSAGLLLVSMTEITERRAAEVQLAHQATHDALTGLPNRTVLIERLRILGRAQRSTDSAGAVVFFIDLDEFKTVNDTLGHAAGDQVLTEVARRLRRATRADDLVARLGGDEFVVVAAPLVGELEALAYADRLHAALLPPVVVNGQPVTARASIGIAISSADDAGGDALLRHADIAMLKAKADRAGQLVFDDVLNSSRRQHSDAVAELRAALDSGAIQTWFQPVVRLADGAVVGAEALVRWVQDDGTVLPPAHFVPLAERTGLIGPLDRAVMFAAARALATGPLQALGSCAVNASPLQITSGLIIDEITSVLDGTGLSPDRLTVELTETAVLADPRAAAQHLAELRQLGVQIALDDFGTGFSSLSHLAELPIGLVKLDRSFVDRMTRDERAWEICRAVVALGAALKMAVIAEGVETPEQRDALIALRCPYAQGYLYGKAIPADQFATDHLSGPRQLR